MTTYPNTDDAYLPPNNCIVLLILYFTSNILIINDEIRIEKKSCIEFNFIKEVFDLQYLEKIVCFLLN